LKQQQTVEAMRLSLKQVIVTFLEVNFLLAAAAVVIAGLTSLSNELSAFDFNSEFAGALDNSLRMMMFYLAVTEIIVLVYCFANENFRSMLFVGFFLILIIGSLEFYGEMNGVIIDEKLPLFFLYTGASHSLYGLSVILAGKFS